MWSFLSSQRQDLLGLFRDLQKRFRERSNLSGVSSSPALSLEASGLNGLEVAWISGTGE